MRLTFALNPNPAMARLNDAKAPNILCAFPYKKAFEMLDYTPEYFIADSGAFTAWSIGKDVDISAYADWVLEIMEQIPRTVAVNLDVIPGEKGRDSTKEERLAGMRDSLKNADYLRDRGLDVMEVFHQDEPKEFLDELLDRRQGQKILGVSPRNDVHGGKKLVWLNTVLAHMKTRYGIEDLPKTHGLAATSKRLIESFPFYSADSSSWGAAARFGSYTDEMGATKMSHKLFEGRRVGYKESGSTIHYMISESIANQMRLGDAVTSLWRSRGVVWED